MKAFVDPEVCIGCTLCTQICPEIFKMDGDKAIAYKEEVTEKYKGTCRDAADQCPVNAITIQA